MTPRQERLIDEARRLAQRLHNLAQEPAYTWYALGIDPARMVHACVRAHDRAARRIRRMLESE